MLEPRDLEILRTLWRLRYVTSRQLNQTFFSNERVGRRRFQRLAAKNLIRVHRNGLPPRTQWGAWRIMGQGVEIVANHYPDEVVPDDLQTRVAEGSLLNLEDRERASQIYLDYIAPHTPPTQAVTSVAQARLWAREIRRRAQAISWSPVHDVVLRYEQLGKRTQIVPDATITVRARGLRVYLMLDHAGRDSVWVVRHIKAYQDFVRFQEVLH
jgi:hypothetical protein